MPAPPRTHICAAGDLWMNCYRSGSHWGIIWESPLSHIPDGALIVPRWKVFLLKALLVFSLFSIFPSSPLFPSIPLAPCLARPPSLPSFPSLLHSALARSIFFLLSFLLLFCHRTAVQRQISVFVPVRQKRGKPHAKTQSANADKGGGIRTSVHTKHQTHLNHKMKWLTSAELENIFLPSLF